MAQDPPEGLDYECELVIVIGKPAKDVPESKALDYVFGYSVGNDVSHREWQIKKGGGQWWVLKLHLSSGNPNCLCLVGVLEKGLTGGHHLAQQLSLQRFVDIIFGLCHHIC